MSLEPIEISSYRRRIIGKSWFVAGILGAILALCGLWNWTLGVIVGLSLGMINFILLCRQTVRLQNAALEKGKSFMILGHWMRYLLMGLVVFLVYRKGSVSFPAFLIGLALVYVVIFFDAWWRGFKTSKAVKS